MNDRPPVIPPIPTTEEGGGENHPPDGKGDSKNRPVLSFI